MRELFHNDDIFTKFLGRMKTNEYVHSFCGYDITIRKTYGDQFIFTKHYKTKDFRHRFDGPAFIQETYSKDRSKYVLTAITENWFVDNKSLPYWVPRVKNGNILFDSGQTYMNNYSRQTWRVDKKSIMEITFKFNRAYGLYLDDIYEEQLKNKEKGIKPLVDLIDVTLNEIKGKWINIETYASDITSIFLGEGFNKDGPQARAMYSLINEILSKKIEKNEIMYNKEDKLLFYKGKE